MDIVYTFEDIFVNDFVRKREIPAEERIRRRDWRPYSLREGGKPPPQRAKNPRKRKISGIFIWHKVSLYLPQPLPLAFRRKAHSRSESRSFLAALWLFGRTCV